jgi:PKD repeat protein
MSGGGGSGFGAGGPGWGYRGLGGDNGNYLNKTGITVTPGNDYVIIVGAGAPETPTGLVVGSPGGFSLAFDNNMTGGAGGLMGAINSGNGGAGSTGFLTGGNAAAGGDVSGYTGGAKGEGWGAGGGGGSLNSSVAAGVGGRGSDGIVLITDMNYAEVNAPDFVGSPLSGNGGMLVTFTDQSTIKNAAGLTYLWDFGDGGTSNTTGSVNHVYSYTGIYTVSLTLTSDWGPITQTKKDYVTISSTNYYDPDAPPKNVRFHIQTLWGLPLSGATVSILGVSTSTGNWEWLETLTSIPIGAVAINGTTMTATTDSTGNVEFLMVPSVRYNVTTTMAGYTFPPFFVTPHDSQYNIISDVNGSGWFGESGNNTLEQYDISVSSTKLSDTVGEITVNFTDTSGSTIGGNITIAQDNTTVKGGPDEIVVVIPIYSSKVSETRNVTVPQEGGAYKVFVNPYGAAGPDIKAIRTFAVWFKGHPITFAGFSPTILLWFSMFLIIFLAMFAGATHAPQMAIILCITSWILYGMGWLDPVEANDYVGTPVLVFTLGFATVMAIVWNIREGNRRP